MYGKNNISSGLCVDLPGLAKFIHLFKLSVRIEASVSIADSLSWLVVALKCDHSVLHEVCVQDSPTDSFETQNSLRTIISVSGSKLLTCNFLRYHRASESL